MEATHAGAASCQPARHACCTDASTFPVQQPSPFTSISLRATISMQPSTPYRLARRSTSMRWSAPVWGEDRRAPHHGRAWPWSGPVMTPGGHTRLLPSVPGIRGSLAVRTRLQHTDSTQIALTLRVLRTALPAALIVVPTHLQARHCRPAALLWRQQQQAPCVHAVQQCKEGLCLASALHGNVHGAVAAGLPPLQARPARMCRHAAGVSLSPRPWPPGPVEPWVGGIALPATAGSGSWHCMKECRAR